MRDSARFGCLRNGTVLNLEQRALAENTVLPLHRCGANVNSLRPYGFGSRGAKSTHRVEARSIPERSILKYLLNMPAYGCWPVIAGSYHVRRLGMMCA